MVVALSQIRGELNSIACATSTCIQGSMSLTMTISYREKKRSSFLQEKQIKLLKM
jgi:hypothetical protein